MPTELTRAESTTLTRHEAIIERGFGTFLDVGLALIAIRDAKLFRATHQTFDAYCLDRWSMSKSYVYRMIAAAEVTQQLAATCDDVPRTESVARPLSKIRSEKQRRKIWTEVRRAAGRAPITARHVRSVMRQHQSASPPTPRCNTPLYKGGTRPDGEATLLQAIRQAIIQKSLKQSAVAMQADVEETNLSEFLNGKRSLRQDSIDRLMMALHLHVTSMPVDDV